MPPPPTRPARESGVALLIVLVVLFIVAVLMVDITLTATTARRSARNASSEFLMDAAIEGRFLVMAAQLTYDAAENKVDSTDDRWARPEYAEYTAPPKSSEETGREAETGAQVMGDSDDVTVKARCEAENAKFNLNLLVHPVEAQKKIARDRFAVLLDRFREDTPLDISTTKATELRDRVCTYLDRTKPTPGETGKFPVAKAGGWMILTPDELRNVEGFEDTAHGLGPEGILFDARDPKAAMEYEADPENVKKPDVCPGLLRFVTLWSGDAWKGKPTEDTWKSLVPVNVNLAAKPVLETLFWDHASDMIFAERIVEHRETQKEGSKTPEGEEPEADEPLPTHQVLEKLDDLKKIDGLDDAVLTRNDLTAATVTFQSDTFSLDFLATKEKAFKQVRYVVRRNNQGFQTLLREVRADPRLDEEEDPAGEAR